MRKSGTAQFVMATHSPIPMALPGAMLLELGPDGAGAVNFRDTGHFKLYERFPRPPEAYLTHLFGKPPTPTNRHYADRPVHTSLTGLADNQWLLE